ncbi:hypothetical protein ACFQO7_30320, partial [Catellatospora aurea]
MSQRRRRASAKAAPPPARRRAPLWSKLAVTFGALLMMISGGSLIAVKSFADTLRDSVEVAAPEVLAGPSGSAAPDASALKGAFDILMLGIDTRSGQKADNARSDT